MPWRAELFRARSITVRSARSRHWRSSAKSACSSWPLRWRNHLSVFRTNDSTLPTAKALARSPAVGDDHQVSLFLGELRLAFFGQAGLAHLHGLGEPGDQEMILVVNADFADVRQGAELDPHPSRIAIGDRLELTGRVVERGLGSWSGIVVVLFWHPMALERNNETRERRGTHLLLPSCLAQCSTCGTGAHRYSGPL